MRPREFLELLEKPNAPRSTDRGEQAEILSALLVHLFFADLDLDARELKLLQRVLPDGNTREYVKSIAARRLDLDRLAALFPDAADRRDIIRLAEHAAWGDERIARRERALIDRLAETLGLSAR